MADNTTHEYGNGVTELFGRSQIFCTVDELNEDNIIYEVNSALSIHIKNLMEMEYLYWYRRGIQPILNRKKDIRPDILNRVVENIADSVVSFKNGYFLTKPCFYISRSDDDKITEKVKDQEEELKELKTSLELLRELGAQNKPVITVYNKCDIAQNAYLMPAERNSVKISAVTGVGLDALLELIGKNMPEQTVEIKVTLPYKEAALAAWLHENARVKSEAYEEDGVHIAAQVAKSALYRFLPYLT